jgi:hypothetical protein
MSGMSGVRGRPRPRPSLILLIVASCLVVAGCAPARDAWRTPDADTFRRLGERLAREREERSGAPWSFGVRVALREPRTGRIVEGRGAVAVAPGQAVRMILVQGPGSTVMDAWVAPDRWRVAIPPIDVVRRGGADEATDLPIGFLRWWFLAPLAGDVFAAASDEARDRWLLRAGDAVVSLTVSACARGEAWEAIRRTGSRVERVRECRAGAKPSAGDSADYDDASSGLRVHVEVDESTHGPPDPDAFRDPDTAAAP